MSLHFLLFSNEALQLDETRMPLRQNLLVFHQILALVQRLAGNAIGVNEGYLRRVQRLLLVLHCPKIKNHQVSVAVARYAWRILQNTFQRAQNL